MQSDTGTLSATTMCRCSQGKALADDSLSKLIDLDVDRFGYFTTSESNLSFPSKDQVRWSGCGLSHDRKFCSIYASEQISTVSSDVVSKRTKRGVSSLDPDKIIDFIHLIDPRDHIKFYRERQMFSKPRYEFCSPAVHQLPQHAISSVFSKLTANCADKAVDYTEDVSNEDIVYSELPTARASFRQLRRRPLQRCIVEPFPQRYIFKPQVPNTLPPPSHQDVKTATRIVLGCREVKTAPSGANKPTSNAKVFMGGRPIITLKRGQISLRPGLH